MTGVQTCALPIWRPYVLGWESLRNSTGQITSTHALELITGLSIIYMVFHMNVLADKSQLGSMNVDEDWPRTFTSVMCRLDPSDSCLA